jgi:hypothetical protein
MKKLLRAVWRKANVLFVAAGLLIAAPTITYGLFGGGDDGAKAARIVFVGGAIVALLWVVKRIRATTVAGSRGGRS